MEIKATSAVVTRGASGLGGATLRIATAGGNVVILERDAIGDGLDPSRVDAMLFDQAGNRMSGKLQGPQVPEGLARLDEGDSSASNNRDASSNSHRPPHRGQSTGSSSPSMVGISSETVR